MSNLQALRNQVAEALADKPSEQPVGFNAKAGDSIDNGAKPRQSIAQGYKAKQKGNPNKSYSVDVINRAKARIG